MAETSDVTLILHGWGGNKPEHWQEHLYKALSEAGAAVRYPKLPDPTAPSFAAWLPAIKTELEQISDKSHLTVVAHSLGAISWLHLAATSTGRLAERVLLVAPPYVVREIPPLDAPPGIEGFFPPPLDAKRVAEAAEKTVIVGGDNDDYATFDQMSAYAGRLGIDIYKLEGGGHISPYWGYGAWPWVHEWCLRKTELPPLPK
jgi:predicted alpha/beta hydrolase family esterase